MDWIDVIVKLFNGFIGIAATAVHDHPIVTVLAFASVFLWLHFKPLVRLVDDGRFKTQYSPREITLIMAGVIVSLIVAFFVGAILDWILRGLEIVGRVFGITIPLVASFAQDPLAYLAFISLLTVAAFLFWVVRRKGRLRGLGILRVVATAWIILLMTHVFTSVYAAATRSDPATVSSAAKPPGVALAATPASVQDVCPPIPVLKESKLYVDLTFSAAKIANIKGPEVAIRAGEEIASVIGNNPASESVVLKFAWMAMFCRHLESDPQLTPAMRREHYSKIGVTIGVLLPEAISINATTPTPGAEPLCRRTVAFDPIYSGRVIDEYRCDNLPRNQRISATYTGRIVYRMPPLEQKYDNPLVHIRLIAVDAVTGQPNVEAANFSADDSVANKRIPWHAFDMYPELTAKAWSFTRDRGSARFRLELVNCGEGGRVGACGSYGPGSIVIRAE